MTKSEFFSHYDEAVEEFNIRNDNYLDRIGKEGISDPVHTSFTICNLRQFAAALEKLLNVYMVDNKGKK